MAFLIAGAALLWGLLSSIRIRYSLTLGRERALVFLTIRFFFGLIPFRAQACLSYFPLRLHMGNRTKELVKKARRFGKKERPLIRTLLKERKRWLQAGELRIRGTVGNQEDACAAILWAGALSIALDCGARVLLSPASFQIRVLPICGARCFCLNLEGIVTLRIWQIIGVAIRQQKKLWRGKHLWHIPLKTS